MKKSLTFILSIILCAMVFAGCSATANIDYTDTYIFGQDSQESYIRYESSLYYAADDSSYYFFNPDNRFLYVIDKSKHICRPLCNKSDCLHDKEISYKNQKKCNAYIDTEYECMVYNDGYIYCMDEAEVEDKDGIYRLSAEIIKISTDGSKRETVYATSDYSIRRLKIHRGYMYFEGVIIESDGTAVGSNKALFRLPLTGGEPEELLSCYKNQDAFIIDTRFYGNHIFIEVAYKGENKIINYDLTTDTYIDTSEKLTHESESLFTIFNDKLIFESGNIIYECDFDGGNERKIIDCKKKLGGYQYYFPYTNDGEHLIISPADDFNSSDKVIFCDKDYNIEVHTLPIKFRAEIGFDKNAFIYYDEENSSLYLVNKSDFKYDLIYNFSF